MTASVRTLAAPPVGPEQGTAPAVGAFASPVSILRELEDIITSAQHVPSEKTVQALREQLNQDTQILASLDPNSDAYERLSARIERQTTELLDYEDQRERQRQATRRALVEQHRRDRETDARMGGMLGVVTGGVVIYMAWGTWWLALGIILVLGGLYGLFAKDI